MPERPERSKGVAVGCVVPVGGAALSEASGRTELLSYDPLLAARRDSDVKSIPTTKS
jgi:hypothetical protein